MPSQVQPASADSHAVTLREGPRPIRTRQRAQRAARRAAQMSQSDSGRPAQSPEPATRRAAQARQPDGGQSAGQPGMLGHAAAPQPQSAALQQLEAASGPQPSWARRPQGPGLQASSICSSAAHGSLRSRHSIQSAPGYGLHSSSASPAPACTWARYIIFFWVKESYRHGHRHQRSCRVAQWHLHSPCRLSGHRCHQQSGMSSWSGWTPTQLSACSTAGLP